MPILLASCFYIGPEEYDARFDLDDDGVARPADCDDDDASVQRRVFYVDDDGDGHGAPGTGVEGCERPDGYADVDDDCDDTRDDVYTGAPELCDERDNDCDDEIDESVQLVTWYRDDDGDTFGTDTDTVVSCDRPDGYVADGTDCDDTTADVHPEAVEVCNGIDDDCDDAVDLDDPDMPRDAYTWYPDGDEDGYAADDATATVSCDPPTGHVADQGDCDDLDPYRNPGVDEVCDGVDNDCNDKTDGPESVDAEEWFEDADGDGFGDPTSRKMDCVEPYPGTWVPADAIVDCDDTDPERYPGATECCDDGIDNDCNPSNDTTSCLQCDSGTP